MFNEAMGTKELGQLIRTAREGKNLRGYDLAFALKQVPSWLTKLETGQAKHLPDPTLLKGLSEALDVSEIAMLRAMGYLSEEQDAQEAGLRLLDQLDRELILRTAPLSVEEKRNLLKYVSFMSGKGLTDDAVPIDDRRDRTSGSLKRRAG